MRHHPDRGGDAEALHAALAEVDRQYGVTRGPQPVVQVRRTRRHRWRTRLARLGAAVNRRRPGATRWIDL